MHVAIFFMLMFQFVILIAVIKQSVKVHGPLVYILQLLLLPYPPLLTPRQARPQFLMKVEKAVPVNPVPGPVHQVRSIPYVTANLSVVTS